MFMFAKCGAVIKSKARESSTPVFANVIRNII